MIRDDNTKNSALRRSPSLPVQRQRSIPLRIGMAAPQKRTIAPLTTFRFFAAMGVVMHHFFQGPESGVPDSSRLHLLAVYGYLGVPFFFILSGYILTYSYASTPEKAASLRKP